MGLMNHQGTIPVFAWTDWVSTFGIPQPIHATLLHYHLPSTPILPTEKSQQLLAKLALVIQTGCTHKSSPNFLLDTENTYTRSLAYEWSKAPFASSCS